MTVYRVKHNVTKRYWLGGIPKKNQDLYINRILEDKDVEPTPENCWRHDRFSIYGKIWTDAAHVRLALRQLPEELLDELEVISYELKDERHKTFSAKEIQSLSK